MASRTTCDRCHRDQNGRLSWNVQIARGTPPANMPQGWAVQSDLCEPCWKGLLEFLKPLLKAAPEPSCPDPSAHEGAS